VLVSSLPGRYKHRYFMGRSFRVHRLDKRRAGGSTAVAFFFALALVACAHPPAPPLRSTLVHAGDGAPRGAPWGQWRPRVRGDATRGMSLSLFSLAPGQAPHPPHKHAEEELLILVTGTGVWHLNGQESPAGPGDVVYAAPWEMHGLRNTGSTPLDYYVLKSASGRLAP
jgi:mannose-6-phosphate isomerase-like protein (cupin superfamily)